ncbi:bile salt-activated lipase-like [Leptidea sinapis]|uniref:bile salt-activated lipase-like n=1 Tax=Leptidea sinapis TaxID=189913 RepID=UPI0021349BD9|nr:bile salt-activated lipase-like [Leptidea sinapis]
MTVCIQPGLFNVIIGIEDCLMANVYVPAMTSRPLPVMVFIHGGAFLFGSGGKFLYGPEFFMRKEVILVTFNYRLGALGFTCLGIKEAPGNAGLKDQRAALRWVKKNIAAFGGDPDNITLFGESAGATSTAILNISNSTEGLFNRVIIQSGTSISNWAINRNPVWRASLVAKALGFDAEDPYDLYKIFSEANVNDLISVPPGKPVELFFDTELLHLPCIESIIPGEEPIITDLPFNILSKKVKDIPMIMGSNTKEGMFLTTFETDESLSPRNSRYLVASDLRFKTEDEGMEVSQTIREFYFDNEPLSTKNIKNVTKFYTHLFFEIPAMQETELLLNQNESPVFNYLFNYSGRRNFVKQRTIFSNEEGACHGDDLFYMFNSLLLPFRITEKDWNVMEQFTNMWTNFAKYGDPTPKNSHVPIRWEPSSKTEGLKFLYIDEESKMGPMPDKKAYDLWKGIYQKYRKLNVSLPSIEINNEKK